MDGQDGDPLPLSPGRRGGETAPGLLQAVQPQEELEQGAAAALLQLAGQGVQGQQVGLPPLAPLHGPEDTQEVGLFVDMPDELPAGAVPRPEAQLLQLLQKFFTGPVSPVGRPDQGGVEVPGAVRAQQGQLVGGEAVHRGAQGGDEGDVLPGVVHDAQNGQGHPHLGAFQEVLPPVGGPGDARLLQGPDVVGQHAARTAQEDHHVGGPQGPLPLLPLHQQGPAQQLPHPPGGKAGLQQVLALLLPLLVPQEGQVQGVQFQGVALPRRERPAGDQGLVVGVVQLPEIS